jgi:type I restriction enzyme S subunit
MEDLGIGQKNFFPTLVKPLSEVVGSYTYFADGDLLLAKITPCFENGKLGIAAGLSNGMGFGSSEYIVFRPGPSIEKDWLYYFLSRESFRKEGAKRMTGAVGHKRVAKEFIEAYPIPLPPLPAILDEAVEGVDAAAAHAEKNLANARELFDSYLNSVFTQKGKGWVEKTLHQVSLNFGRGKSKHRPRNDPKLYNGPYPFIQTGDVRNCDHVILESTQSYNEIGLAQSKLWPKGTICITIAANIAETGILGFDACFPDSVIGIVVDETKTTIDFVEYLLQSVKAHLKAQGKGSAQDNINLATFENRLFPFPPLDEQQRLVKTLNELSANIRAVEAVYRQKLAALAELKQSILQKAFAGKLIAQPEKALQEAAE